MLKVFNNSIEIWDLAQFQFPDGLEHISIGPEALKRLSDSRSKQVIINARIRNGSDLVMLAQTHNVLNNCGFLDQQLNLMYLSSGRMDRAISEHEPHSLSVYLKLLATMNFSSIIIHCPHNPVAMRSMFDKKFDIRISSSEEVFFDEAIFRFSQKYGFKLGDGSNFSLVYPDKGAKTRFSSYVPYTKDTSIVQCEKIRCPQTGKLSDFAIKSGKVSKHCLILDDLCDGGGTFAGIAGVLKQNGAEVVELAAFHGIMSKGLPIQNVDHIYTTNSYKAWDRGENQYIECAFNTIHGSVEV